MSQIRMPVTVAVAVVPACLIAAFVTAPTTGPGEQTSGIVSTAAASERSKGGGPVTRGQVIRRAQSWVDQRVPYSQKRYFPPTTGWRTDCSGFVSMAWMLPDSETTLTLPRLTTPIPTSELRPGDILNSPDHVVLFADWIDQKKGTFSFYQESNERVPTNKSTGSLNAAKIAGIPAGTYKALRYNRIADDTPAPAPTPTTAPSAAPTKTSTPQAKPKPAIKPTTKPEPTSPAPVSPSKSPAPKPEPTTPPPPVVGGGLRTWVNAATNMCLEIRRSLGHDGATANQWTCNNSSSQKWTTTNPGGWTTIVHMDSGKCLEIRGDIVANGATANQWTCNGSATQSWRWQAQPGGGWSLVNANSGKCLTIHGHGDGALAVQQPCDNSRLQTWN
ncbi:RICIN domain-containing protein [Streptomyces sp. NPDC006512]|uniref:RICIN domain-containing protein n=1 Tax=Streptomyces sp. NPDC006512 TaxID=3154307 RepID=UPI0033A05240